MKRWIFTLLFFVFQIIPAQTQFQREPTVRVQIINTADTLSIHFNNEWILTGKEISPKHIVKDAAAIFILDEKTISIKYDDEILSLPKEELILKSSSENGTLKIKNVPFGVGWWWANKEDRIYEGEFHIYPAKENKFEVVIHLPLEKYLMGVVPYEIGNDSPLEALKAQAVAARSEAIMALSSGRHSGNHHDLTSDVECQVFSGNNKRNEETDLAVLETKSLILAEKCKPINAYYASNCGGHSELITNVWGDRPSPDSYIISHVDALDSLQTDLSSEENAHEWILSNPNSFCNPSNDLPDWSRKNFRWKREFSIDEITKMISRGKELGKLLDIKSLKRGNSGRVIHVKYIFEEESIEAKGELNIRQMFIPPLRSSAFIVDKNDSGFILTGAGWGHGVGMCQSGAIGMAKKNFSFVQILQHYYRKAELLNIY